MTSQASAIARLAVGCLIVAALPATAVAQSPEPAPSVRPTSAPCADAPDAGEMASRIQGAVPLDWRDTQAIRPGEVGVDLPPEVGRLLGTDLDLVSGAVLLGQPPGATAKGSLLLRVLRDPSCHGDRISTYLRAQELGAGWVVRDDGTRHFAESAPGSSYGDARVTYYGVGPWAVSVVADTDTAAVEDALGVFEPNGALPAATPDALAAARALAPLRADLAFAGSGGTDGDPIPLPMPVLAPDVDSDRWLRDAGLDPAETFGFWALGGENPGDPAVVLTAVVAGEASLDGLRRSVLADMEADGTCVFPKGVADPSGGRMCALVASVGPLLVHVLAWSAEDAQAVIDGIDASAFEAPEEAGTSPGSPAP